MSKDNTGSATFQIEQAVSPNVQLDGSEKSEYNGQAVSFDPSNEETKKNFGFNNVQGLTIPDLTADDFEWVDQDGKTIAAPTDAGYYYLQLNEKGKSAFANANPNYIFIKDGESTISGRITYHIYPANLIIGVSGTASQVYNGQNAAITQAQLDNGDIKLMWGNSNDEPIGLGSFTLTPEDLEVVDSAGNPVSHANAQENDKTGNPAYYVRLTSATLNKIKNLTGASNYDISLGGTTGNFLIYARKAQVTLNGNQTTTYGTDLPLDPSAYHIELTNWNSSVPGPTDAEIIQKIGGLKTGDVYINGFTDGQMPVNVGSYQVKITDQLLQKLQAAFPDYDWDAVSGNNGTARSGSSNSDPIDARHEPATYVITPADTTVTINGTEHIKYGENTTIQYGGDNGYSITITAPVKNATTDNEHEPIYTDLKLEAGDLEFVTTPGNVGTYEVKLSAQGLKKLQALTGSTNYNWTQASEARANFFVDQMPVTITVGGNEQSVTYGSNDWLTAIKKNPQGYTITVTTENGTSLNYQAKTGDLIFSQTPGNVGSYQVVLSKQGLDNIKTALGTNYAYPQAASDVTTYGTFTVNPGEVMISLDGSDSKTYDGKTTVPADLNLDKYNLTYSATVYAPDGTAQTIDLTADDLQFASGDPINAGTYPVELSPAGQAKLKNLTGNNGDNYKWTFNTKATYTINAATDASASLSGSNQMIFNGSTVTTAEINNGGDIIVNLTFPGSTENSIYHLQDGDYIWTDGTAPTNVGTYTIKLTQAGLAHLQAAIDQYAGSGNAKISADSLTGSATFEIVPKSITDVTISGSNQEKTYDGQAASLDVNDSMISATDLVTDSPLSMKGITASDFDWYDAQGKKLDTIPTDAGAYEACLKPSALQALQKDNPNYSFNTASGTIRYTINQKAATDTLGGNGNKVYNGQEISVSDVFNSITWTPSDLVDGQSLDLSNLTADDYAWYTKNADGTYTEMTGLPTNAGTYYLKLKDSSIAKIQAANPNYSFATCAISGEYTYVIDKATAKISISGSQTTKDLAIDSNNYQDSVKTNNDQDLTVPQLTANDFVVVKDGQKIKVSQLSEAGTYAVELSEEAISKIHQANPNYNIDFSSTATFTLENSSQTINYVDADNKVISSTNISGHIKGTKLPFTPQFPAGWVASDPNSVPNEITLENEITTIKIKHGVTNVDHANPVPDGEKTVTGSVIDGAHENDLNQTITRTIVVTNPDGTKQTITQAAKIYRDATYDNVTGEVTYGEWSTAKWDAYIPNAIKGYTPSESSVPAVEVKDGQQDETVNITYTANEQSGIISYQDTAGKEIETTPLSGKTGETIAITPEIPAGWQLVPSQEIPKTVTATADGIPTVIVKVEHGTVVVTPETPATDIPTGKVPGDPSKNYPTMEQLTITPTQTINVKYPSGEEQAIPQKVTFTRIAIFDEVTGEIKYTEWLPQGTAQWASYQPTTVTGYVPSQKIVPAMTVNPKTPDETVDITYDKIPEPQEGQEIISYQDANGQVIHTQTITGEEDSNVSFKPEVPTNWQPTGELPHSIKITGGTTVIVIEPVTTTIQEHKTVTRTIVEHLPSGDKQTVQTIVLTGTGTKNLVTGEVTDVKWDHGKFVAFTPATVPGYTTNMRIVPEADITAASGDSTVEINYIPNEQTGFIIYRDENGNEITRTALQGKTGEAVAINLALPAGWELVPGQSIPATVMATSDGIPDVVVLIKHQMIVKPGEKAPTGKVPGNPSTTYEKMESLTKEVTRTITIKLPDEQRQVITQTVKFTRTATFDAVTGKVTYSGWQVAGSDEWPAYPTPEINGYTASQTSVPAEMVIPSDENQNITIEYTKNNQPVEPAKPVTPTQPAQPTEPSVPAKPTAPTNNGDKVMSGNQLPTEPVEQERQQVSNQHFISHQLTQTSSREKPKANTLPQTGNDQNSSSILGFAFAALASILGLTGLKKKKREK